jgi:hypothetical protein
MKLATVEDGRTATGFGHDGGAASDSGDGAVGTERGDSDSSSGAVGTALHYRDAGTARGSHVAMARCQVGPARTAASDRWDPLVSVFRIKITRTKIAQNK